MKISAVMLAGGTSSRMGQDKTTMTFQNKPLWQKQLELLQKLAPQEIFISARSDPPWRPADVKFVADCQPSRGPLSGIAAALSRAANDRLIALAVDMPFMSPDYFRELFQQSRPGRGVVPMIDNRSEPLAAIYPRDARDDVIAALSGRDFSLQSLVRRLIAANKLMPIQVSGAEKDLFRNLNEPVDLQPPMISL